LYIIYTLLFYYYIFMNKNVQSEREGEVITGKIQISPNFFNVILPHFVEKWSITKEQSIEIQWILEKLWVEGATEKIMEILWKQE